MNGTNTAGQRPTGKQQAVKKKREPFRINALDILILLLIIAAVAAFVLRERVQMLFAEEGASVVTYTFQVDHVETATAEALKTGTKLCDAEGTSMGEVLACISADSTDTWALPDGKIVDVRNGLLLLSCTATATGYETDGFICLNGGLPLVPGGVLEISTGDAFFTVRITGVSISGT